MCPSRISSHQRRSTGLSIIPSSISLAGAEVELAPVAQRERRLARLIRRPHRLRLHPPRLPAVARPPDRQCADCGARGPDPDPMRVLRPRGTDPTIATINLVRDHLNPDLADQGRRSDDVRRTDEPVRRSGGRGAAHLGEAVFDTVIPRNVRLSEAPSYGQPIALYRPDSRGAEAYRALAGDDARASAATAAAHRQEA